MLAMRIKLRRTKTKAKKRYHQNIFEFSVKNKVVMQELQRLNVQMFNCYNWTKHLQTLVLIQI